jgi:hypothetical protein
VVLANNSLGQMWSELQSQDSAAAFK